MATKHTDKGYENITMEQIERLGNDLEDQVKKGESLEARASEAEKSLLELGQKLEHVSTHVHVLNSQCLLWDMLWHWVGRRICHVIHMFFRLRRSISSRGRKSRSWNIIFRMQRCVHSTAEER